MIIEGGEYEHRKKGFRVIAGAAAWWDGPARSLTVRVVVHRLKHSIGRGRASWTVKMSSFNRLYKLIGAINATATARPATRARSTRTQLRALRRRPSSS